MQEIIKKKKKKNPIFSLEKENPIIDEAQRETRKENRNKRKHAH